MDKNTPLVCMNSFRRRGFTLIELLVVIAIIAILAAILFPVFAKAKEKAKQATCTSNLKQMGLAIAAYCQDYDDFMPMSNSYGVSDPNAGYGYIWISAIHPYIAGCAWDGGGPNTSKVLFCPASDKEILLNRSTARKGSKITNYMYHKRLGGMGYVATDPTYRPRTLAKCLSSSTCAVMVDGICQSYSWDPAFDVVVYASGSINATGLLDPRHNGGLNILYADNHVSWFNLKSASKEQVTKIFMWDNWKDWPY